MKRVFYIGMAAVLFLADAAKAQDAAPQPALELAQMRNALRTMAMAQEIHYSNASTYSDRLDALKQYPIFVMGAGVTVTVIEASTKGWAAVTTHATLPGESCVFWVGAVKNHPTTASKKRSSENQAGRAVCDGDPS